MAGDEFTKLFTYMQAEFKQIQSQLEQTATKDDLNRLYMCYEASSLTGNSLQDQVVSVA